MIILTSINLSWWIALINCKKKSFGNGTLTISVFWTFRTDKLIKKKSKGGGEIFSLEALQMTQGHHDLWQLAYSQDFCYTDNYMCKKRMES